MTTDYQLAVRQDVYDAISGERDYQDKLNDRWISPGEELLLLQEYVDRARTAWTKDFGKTTNPEYLHVVRKIAGIAVRCMEHHGVLRRERVGTLLDLSSGQQEK